jgi:hypothetical protein
VKGNKPFNPTKSCPHRWCRPLHTLMALLFLAMVGPILLHAGWAFLIFSALLVVLTTYIIKLAWNGKSLMDRAKEEAAAQGSGAAGNMSTRHLLVRPVWANLAVGMDVLFAVALSAGLWDTIRGTSDYSVPDGSLAAIISIGVACGWAWFREYAHRKATEPAKPVRLPLLVPAPGKST